MMVNGRRTLRASDTLIILACCTAIFTLQVKSLPVESENGMSVKSSFYRRPSQPYANSLGESTTNRVRRTPPRKAVGKVLIMAALNKPMDGYMRGIPQADQDCYRQGYRSLRQRRTFRAFLSSSDQDVWTIVDPKDRDLPIVNIKGEILFNSWNEMFNEDGAPISPGSNIYSFKGKNVLTDSTWPEKAVWHGSTETGDLKEDAHCNAWRKYPYKQDRQGNGSPLDEGRILDEASYSCEQKLAVLCIEAVSMTSKRRP